MATLEIEPMLITLDAKGRTFVGSGDSRTMLDSDPTDHTLPMLHSQLALFSAAAKAANCQAPCMLYVEGTAPYQRVIDVLSRFHANDIGRIIFIDLTDLGDDSTTTCRGMNFDHQERMEQLRNKPKPTAPSAQSR
jgi:biopolymer transport protein ExbD